MSGPGLRRWTAGVEDQSGSSAGPCMPAPRDGAFLLPAPGSSTVSYFFSVSKRSPAQNEGGCAGSSRRKPVSACSWRAGSRSCWPWRLSPSSPSASRPPCRTQPPCSVHGMHAEFCFVLTPRSGIQCEAPHSSPLLFPPLGPKGHPPRPAPPLKPPPSASAASRACSRTRGSRPRRRPACRAAARAAPRSQSRASAGKPRPSAAPPG